MREKVVVSDWGYCKFFSGGGSCAGSEQGTDGAGYKGWSLHLFLCYTRFGEFHELHTASNGEQGADHIAESFEYRHEL